MCTIVITPEGDTVGSVAELRKIWPTLIEAGAGVLEPSDDDDCCLCCVDVPGSARVNGARVEHDYLFDEYRIAAPAAEREG